MSKRVSFDVVKTIGVVFVDVDDNLSEMKAKAKAREILDEHGCGDDPDNGIEFFYDDFSDQETYIFREIEEN